MLKHVGGPKRLFVNKNVFIHLYVFFFLFSSFYNISVWLNFISYIYNINHIIIWFGIFVSKESATTLFKLRSLSLLLSLSIYIYIHTHTHTLIVFYICEFSVLVIPCAVSPLPKSEWGEIRQSVDWFGWTSF